MKIERINDWFARQGRWMVGIVGGENRRDGLY